MGWPEFLDFKSCSRLFQIPNFSWCLYDFLKCLIRTVFMVYQGPETLWRIYVSRVFMKIRFSDNFDQKCLLRSTKIPQKSKENNLIYQKFLFLDKYIFYKGSSQLKPARSCICKQQHLLQQMLNKSLLNMLQKVRWLNIELMELLALSTLESVSKYSCPPVYVEISICNRCKNLLSNLS